MKIKSRTRNCNFQKSFEINELVDSTITLELEMETIASMQSKKQAIIEIKSLVQEELSKFEWVIAGFVQVDLVWYLNSKQRQETDAIGDIDNISKPLLDALAGPKGIIIDDSLINGYHTSWGSRNFQIEMNIVLIIIKFNNDYTLQKQNLFFYQIDIAIYTPIDIRLDSIKNILIIKYFLKQQKLLKKLNMVKPQWDFHRTRLNGFPENIISRQRLDEISSDLGLKYKDVIAFVREGTSKVKSYLDSI